MRVFDSLGRLYAMTWDGGLIRVPAGGGTSVPVVGKASTGLQGHAGTPFVDADDTVLFQAAGRVLRYAPSSGMFTTFANASVTSDFFGFGVLMDSRDQVIALRKGMVFDSAGASVGSISAIDYLVLTDAWVFMQAPTRNFLHRLCWDGSLLTQYAGVFSDGYGLALGPDGALYFGQGNTNPSAIYRVAPGGGAPTEIARVPMAVFGVGIDVAGAYLYVSGSDFDTVWQIRTTNGAKLVYGCDSRSAYSCGATG